MTGRPAQAKPLHARSTNALVRLGAPRLIPLLGGLLVLLAIGSGRAGRAAEPAPACALLDRPQRLLAASDRPPIATAGHADAPAAAERNP